MTNLILKIFILIASVFPSSAINITSASSPDTNIHVGASFQLMCTVQSEWDWCSFRHDNYTCYFEPMLIRLSEDMTMKDCAQYQGRIRFIGSYDMGECGVEITEAKEEDDGEWVCTVEEYVSGHPERVEHTMDVSVGSNVGNSYSHYSGGRDKDYAYFETQSQNFRVARGKDIVFPCHVKNRGNNVITWKTGERLLTAGPIKVYNENRLVHNQNGTTITMREVQPQDSGEYSCQLNLVEHPITLTHTLDVLVPPEVSPRTPEVTVKAGGRTELECIANGNPRPHIHWRRLDGRPIQGETKGEKLLVDNITKDSGGVFICVAQNGVSTNQEEITAQIDLQVLYSPEVRVRQMHHHPRLGQKTLELTCEVFADPHPDVNWYLGRSVLSGHSPHQAKYTMKSDSGLHTHTLIIAHIGEEDYGNYSCHAANSLGEDKATLVVSGVEYLRMSSSGLAGLVQPRRMGLYQLQTPEGNNTYPVYKQVEGDQYIYLGPDKSWRIGPNTRSLEDNGLKTLRLQPVPLSPPEDGWQVYDDDWIADPTVLLEPTTPEYFKLISEQPNSKVMTIQPRRFGVYKLIQQNGSNFPAYAKLGEHEEFLYVLDGHWTVGPTMFQRTNAGISNAVSLGPFVPGFSPQIPPAKEGWMYWNDERWVSSENIQFLPTNPAWSCWSEWSSCSRLCGGGNRTRERTCSAGEFLLNICVGDNLESSECNSEDCPESLQGGGDCTGYSIDNLPSPRIMVLGPTKVGKSTLSNFLLGVDPASPDAPFLASNMKANHAAISWRSGPWLGAGQCFTVIDTPSPAAGGRDHQHAASLMQFIKDEVKSVDVFLLLFNAEHSILTPAAVAQLKLYEEVLGRRWWENVITQMSHWSHSARDVRLRRRKLLNETVMHNRLNEKYKALLNVSAQEIPTTFIDPVLPVFVDEDEYYDYDIDEREMNKYLTHSQNLLDYAKKMKPFTCEDNCKSPDGYYTGQPLIQVDHVSAQPGEQVRIQCQIFTGHHRQNSHNITWTHNGDDIYRKVTAANGNVISDGNISSGNFSFKVTNEFLFGAEDIFFSYLNFTLSSDSTGEYKCENGIPSDTNVVSVVQKTGNLSVLGGWSQWSSWSSCSQMCGGGNQTRTRQCTSQDDWDCQFSSGGESVQKKMCNTFVCANLRVSLVGGAGPHEGNVIAVNSEGYTGPVCDDQWDIDDANVVCRQLGYPHGAVEHTTRSRFGPVDSHMAMDSVECNKSEDHLQDCIYETVDDCTSSEGAGVICRTNVSSSSSVMTNDPGKWEGFFQSKNESYPWIQIFLNTRFPPTATEIHLYNRVDSSGERLRNIEVRAGMEVVPFGFSGSQIQENSVCGHFAGPGDDGGEIIIKCDSPIVANSITIQKLETGILHINKIKVNPTYLVGGNTTNEGNVVVNKNGKYGPICDDGWSIIQANVVCKELGFPGGAETATRNTRFGNVSMEYVMDDVSCKGEEARIEDCTHLLNHDCGPTEVAGVICKDTEGQSRTEGSWGNWTSCSVTCGGGIQTRQKICETKNLCPMVKTVTEQQACNTHICPRGNTTDWRVPCKSPCRTKSCKASKRKINSMLDTSVDPCYDFYTFACGRHKPSDKKQKVDQPFEYLVKNAPPEFKFIKNFYKSCLDAIKPDKVKDGLNQEFYTKMKTFADDGKWPVIVGGDWDKNVLNWFGYGWTWYDFAGYVLANNYYMGSMQNSEFNSWTWEWNEFFFTSAFFSPSIDVAVNEKRFDEKRDSSSRIYIVPMTVPQFLKDKDQVKIEKYRKFMKDTVKQLGAEEEMAEIDMERVLSLEIELAEITETKYSTTMTYPKPWKEVSLTKLYNLVSTVPWLQYINKAFSSSGVKIERGASVLIPNEAVMVRIGKWMDTLSYRDQANLIMWRMFSKFTSNFLNDGNLNLDNSTFVYKKSVQQDMLCIQKDKFQASGHIGNVTVKDFMRECMDDCRAFNGCVAITYNFDAKVCAFHGIVDETRIYDKSNSSFARMVCDDKKRSENCLQQINTFFPNVKDDLYIALNLDKSEVYDIKQLIEAIKVEFEELIHENNWMDAKTKWYAIEKVKEMKANVGELHLKHKNMIELAKLITDDKYIENINVIGNYFYKTAIQDMKNPKDLFVQESEINAWYDWRANEIQMNTGYLKEIGYNIDMPRPLIYGGLVGAILGHELTHGFDNGGKNYGKYGNLFNWWEEPAEKAYKARTQCLINQYNNFKITHNGEEYRTNGTNCLGENISDNGGIKLGYRAFMKHLETHTEKCLPTLDFTPKQLYWIGAALTQCDFDYDKMQDWIVHAAPPWRINTVFSNMPQFSQDFNCPVGAKLNPETRCTVW